MSWLVPDDPGLRLRERAPVAYADIHMRRTGMSLRGRSPLAQTWLKRALLRAMDNRIVEEHNHIPVSSRQGRPPLSLPCGIPRRGFRLTAEIPQGEPLASTTAWNFSVEKKDIHIPHHHKVININVYHYSSGMNYPAASSGVSSFNVMPDPGSSPAQALIRHPV
jgi:hypothetical protein